MTTWSPVPGAEASAVSEHAAALRGSGDAAPALAPAQWRAAEARLYPLVTADPALYEAAVTLVSEAAEILRTQCCSVAELVRLQPSEVLDRCRSAHTAAAMGVDPGTALDAARAGRWRELITAAAGGPSNSDSQR